MSSQRAARCLLWLAPMMLVGLGGEALGRVTTKKAKSLHRAPDYNDAFSDPVVEKALVEGNEAVAKDTPDGGASAMAALAQQSSFPLRVHVGEDAEPGWPEDPGAKKLIPTPVAKRYRLRGCEFSVESGEFALRQYRKSGGDEYVVLADAVQQYSTLPVAANDTLYLSVVTELAVSMPESQRAACAKAFSDGRKVPLGRASLGRSALAMVSGAQQIPATMAHAQPDVEVFIAWDGARNQLRIVDPMGMPPGLESGIYAVSHGSKGDYQLTLVPAVDVQR